MSKYNPVHRGESLPIAGQVGTLYENQPVKHRMDESMKLGESERVASPPRQRLRAHGSAAMNKLRPPTVDWGEAKAILGVVGAWAIFAGGTFYYDQEHQNLTEEVVLSPDYYTHMKASAHGDTLESLVERYGHKHHSPWTRRHATEIAAILEDSPAATMKAHDNWKEVIPSAYKELQPGQEVRIIRDYLEKPSPLKPSSSAD